MMKRMIYKLLLAAVILGGACGYGKLRVYEQAKQTVLQQEIAAKILRFHVVANSDGKKDQNVKLLVRDEIGNYIEPLLAQAQNRAQTVSIVENHLEDICDVAEQVLSDNGCSYGATATVSVVSFPEKTYGSYTFEEGEYLALQVKLGEAKGHNWWCVLYPNMCFRGSVYEAESKDAKAALQEVLSPEEYEAVLREGDYQVRFKFLEYFR